MLTEMRQTSTRDMAEAEQQQAEELELLSAEAENDLDARHTLEKRRGEIAALAKRRAENVTRYATEADVIADMLPELETLESELRQMSRHSDFNPLIAQEWRSLVAAFDKRLQEASCDALAYRLQRALPQVIEGYARYLYTTEPDKLPQDLFDHFSPLWQLQCHETLIFVGLDHPGTTGPQPDARLIDLPPNPLTGVTFGDESRFYVDLPAKALAEGRFMEATASDTHGVY